MLAAAAGEGEGEGRRWGWGWADMYGGDEPGEGPVWGMPAGEPAKDYSSEWWNPPVRSRFLAGRDGHPKVGQMRRRTPCARRAVDEVGAAQGCRAKDGAFGPLLSTEQR